MKEHPIIFSGPMVSAIREGRKTQTRRIVADKRLSPKLTLLELFDFLGGGDRCDSSDDDGLRVSFVKDCDRQDDDRRRYKYTGLLVQSESVPEDGAEEIVCQFGVPGDRLWVRETWTQLDAPLSQHRFKDKPRVAYRADHGERSAFDGNWRPSIHMPRWASRITLEVTKIGAERIQQISGADAIAEGVTYPVSPSEKHPGKCSVLWDISSQFSPVNYIAKRDHGNHEAILRAHFAATWDTLNFKRGFGWKKNPWVWVVEFKQ